MRFEDVKKLHQKRYREELGHYLVEGEHLVLELQKAAEHNPELLACELYLTREHEDWRSPFVTHVVKAGQMANCRIRKHPRVSSLSYRYCRPPPHARTSRPSICTRSRIRAISAPFFARWRGLETCAAC